MKTIQIRNDTVEKRLEEIKKVYKIKTSSKLIEHLLEIEYKKHFSI